MVDENSRPAGMGSKVNIIPRRVFVLVVMLFVGFSIRRTIRPSWR